MMLKCYVTKLTENNCNRMDVNLILNFTQKKKNTQSVMYVILSRTFMTFIKK